MYTAKHDRHPQAIRGAVCAATQATPLIIKLDDGEVLPTETHVVTVSNAPLFASNLPIAPDAKMDDGWLDLAVYDRMDKVDLGRYFLALSTGNRVDDPRVQFQRVRTVEISAAEALAANADVKVLPKQSTWTFEVVPRALSVIAGNGMGLTLPVKAAPAPTLSKPTLTPETGTRTNG